MTRTVLIDDYHLAQLMICVNVGCRDEGDAPKRIDKDIF